MLGTLPCPKKNLGAPLLSRKAMLETLFKHLDMVRLSASAFVMIAVVGCTGLIDGGSDGLTRQERNAREKWETSAFPVFRDNCQTCHNGSRPMIEFLAGVKPFEVYDSIKSYEPAVMNVDAPGSSRVLSKGLHDGPMLTAEQSAAILSWLQAEREATITKATDETQLLATAPFAIQICTAGLPDNAEGTCPTNRVPLDMVQNVGMTIPGANISFTAQALTSSLYLTNLKLNAGTAGAYVEHPLFVSNPAMGEKYPDQIDRFFNVKLNLMANAVEQLSGGTAVFAGFVPTDMMEIHFRVLSAFKPDTGGGTATPGGCKVLASFKTNAAPPLRMFCASCHAPGGNPNARAAMDLTGITNTDDASLGAACAQVRTRINLTVTDQSGFYLTPNPASGTNHPFKFPDVGQFTTNFKTPVDIWVQAEKVAP